MHASTIKVTRLPHRIDPDPSRVIARLFTPGGEARIRRIIHRILQISEPIARDRLSTIEEHFKKNHPDIEEILIDHFNEIKEYIPQNFKLNKQRKRLIGAYFTMEYAIEAAALFNPSMVPMADQSELPEGSTRFLMSLRATGEGHVSSIVFRRGVIDAENNIILEQGSPYSRPLKVCTVNLSLSRTSKIWGRIWKPLKAV